MSARRKRMPHTRWVELIREQERLGLDVERFCRDRDLGVASFHHHRARMRKEKKTGSGFVEIRPAGSGLRLSRGGWVLEVDRDFDAETLRRLLAVAGR